MTSANPNLRTADAPRSVLPPIDVLVATFNSAQDLRPCLAAVRAYLPVHRLIVVDRNSTDGTPAIAREFGAEVYSEEIGLGYARTFALAKAETPFVLFVDSDVILRRPDFYPRALEAISRPRTAAVVGTPVGHEFLYGLPFGLTLLDRRWATSIELPGDAQGFETYYFRRALRKEGRRVRYVPEAMEHRSAYRGGTWPEWQGAQMRLAAGVSPYELTYAFFVVLLIHMNSRRPKNILYTPVFYLKLLRGFIAPDRWRYLDRRTRQPSPG